MSMTVEALAKEIHRLIGIHADELADGLLPFIKRHIAAGQRGAMSAWVGDMKTSAGMDYYVCVGHGEEYGEYMTPHAYKIRGRAEYDVACWNHLFGCCDKPDILAFDTNAPPAVPVESPASVPDGLLREAYDIQRRHYGDGQSLHIAMIGWAKKYDQTYPPTNQEGSAP